MDCLPILVGIVGKIDFEEQDTTPTQTYLSIFEDRFRALVGYLDRRLPLTPKVLLCGGAAGVDLAAARIVLERTGVGEPEHPAWSAVIMLPFDCVLFEQDFRNKPLEWRQFDELKDDCRVTVKTLQPLLLERFDDIRVESPHLARVSRGQLSRDGGSPVDRRQHYEQLGLWIARSSTILVAAMPASEPAAIGHDSVPGAPDAKLGGTARVVAFRRAAMPDNAAAGVLERSSDLLTASPIEEPDGGYVLLIDPTDPHAASGQFPARVLRPIQRMLEVHRDAGPEAMRRLLYQQPGQDPHPGSANDRDTMKDLLNAVLGVPAAFERFHRRQLPICDRLCLAPRRWLGLGQPAWLEDALRRWGPSHTFSDQTPTAFLATVRRRHGPLDRQQIAAHTWYLRLLHAMIGGLLAAVLCYEIFIEFRQDDAWWLIGYVVLVTLTAAAAITVGVLELQLRDEDFRGLKEMLRVQIAWWDAGIPRAVDRIHLRSIDSDLRRLREAGATVVLWAQLRCRNFQPGRVINSDRRNGPVEVREWIAGQAGYFQKSSEGQRRNTLVAERIYMVALIASLLTQFALASGQLSPGVAFFVPAMIATCDKAGLAGTLWLLGMAGAVPLVQPSTANRYKASDIALLFVTGLIVALLALIGARAVAPQIAMTGDEPAFRPAVLTIAVVLLAMGGMARFYTDKLNHSAQAAHYNDMRRAFRRAQDQLAGTHDPFTASDLALIKEMGELALDENEAWLKAHRDRPTRPMASG